MSVLKHTKPTILMPTIRDIAQISVLCPTLLNSSADYQEVERSYHMLYEISNGRTGGTLMVCPNCLLTESPDSIQSRIISTFAAVTEAEHYRKYARSLAIWLTAFHNVNPKITRDQCNDLWFDTSMARDARYRDLEPETLKTQQQAGVVEGNLDSFGFPTTVITDTDSIDSLGTDRFGELHWRVARIHADLIDLPYSFVEMIDLHILLIYIECVLTAEIFDNMSLLDAQLVAVRARFDVDYQQPDIIAMINRLQAILDNDDFQYLSEFTDECVGELTEEQSNVDTEFELDKFGYPAESLSSKHEQYVDCVDEIVDHLATLKALSEKRKVRNFVRKAMARVEKLQESINEFCELNTLETNADKIQDEDVSPIIENGQKIAPMQPAVLSNTDTQQEFVSKTANKPLMQSDALSLTDAQRQFLATTTDATGRSPPAQATNTMGFVDRVANLHAPTMQRPNRNAKASTKLSNTSVSLSSACDDYSPDTKKGNEFFVFG